MRKSSPIVTKSFNKIRYYSKKYASLFKKRLQKVKLSAMNEIMSNT